MAHQIDGSGRPHTFGDVHRNDGHLIRYGIVPRFSIIDKQRLIEGLVDLLMERGNPTVRDAGVKGLQMIARDAGGPANWQGADQIFADDVVAEICALLAKVRELEVVDTALNHIGEQMSDMFVTSGTCPAGRANRLSQVLMFLKDYVEGSYLPSSVRPLRSE